MRKWLPLSVMSCALALTSAFGLMACDSDEADQNVQCASVCNAYVDCNNSTLDREDCVQSCEDFPGGNTSAAFEGCEDCVDSNACENNAWQCETECAELMEFVMTGTGA